LTHKKPAWRQAFLDAFEELGLVTQAARRAGVTRQAAYQARKTDTDFAEAWDEIEDELTERLEREVYRRAVEGDAKWFYDKNGNVVGEETKYSDTLAIVLLKARRPEKYRESKTIEHTGSLNLVELVATVDDA
jgi:hypothetical protein